MLTLLALAATAGACSDVGTPPDAAVAQGSMLDSADQVAFGFRTNITDGGVLRAEVFADTAMFLDQNTRASLRVVNADFYGATGAKEATMTGKIATFDTRSQNMQAWGDVIITSVDGRVLKTPQLRYDQRLNQVTSDSSFVLTEPGAKEMRGVGFQADPNLSVVKVLKLESGRGGRLDLPRT